MKKKLLLGGVAFLVVVGLVVGGTLMLFSDVTEQAENVATFGYADIQLWEDGGKIIRDGQEIDADYSGERHILRDGEGIDFGDNIRPGDILTKEPFIKNVGPVPVYLKAEVGFELWSGGAALTAVEMYDLGFTFSELYAMVNWNISDWAFDGYTVGANNYKSTWYYVDTGSANNLKACPSAGQSTDIFTTVTIPLWLENNLNGYTLKITVKGFAVQSENNPYNALKADYADAQFPA